MIKSFFDWVKQSRRERKHLRDLDFWGYAGPALLHSVPYIRRVKRIKIDHEGRLSYGDTDSDLLPLSCEKVDTTCWVGCPHYKASIFFRVFDEGYSFCCRYYPSRIDVESIDGLHKDIGGTP